MVSERRNARSRSAAFVHQTAELPPLGTVKTVFDAPVVAALKFALPGRIGLIGPIAPDTNGQDGPDA